MKQVFAWLRQCLRWVPGSFRKGAVILVYHRVTELERDPWSLAVSPAHFSEHLEVLRRYCTPLSLAQISASLAAGRFPPRAAAVTFDDGYQDVLSQARPLLERFAVPATLFMATAGLQAANGQAGEFWWDELERILLAPGELPSQLSLEIGGRPYEWNLDDVFQSVPGAERDWKAQQPPANGRQVAFLALWQALQPLDPDAQHSVLNRLRRWAGRELVVRPSHRALDADELLALARGGLVEIGAHTVSHPALARLPAAVQRQEIRQSKKCLETLLGSPVTSFAYPYGKPGDYTTTTRDLVQAAGFERACVNTRGRVTAGCDPFRLPRLYVTDQDGETFARRLANFFRT